MAGIIGKKGSVLAYVGTSEALTEADRLLNVTSFTFPQPEKEEIDVTDFDSDGKEYEIGTPDYGTVEFNYNLKSAEQYDRIDDALEADTVVHFQAFVLDKNGEIIVGKKGKGLVKTNGLEGLERDSVASVAASIRVSGKTERVAKLPTEA